MKRGQSSGFLEEKKFQDLTDNRYSVQKALMRTSELVLKQTLNCNSVKKVMFKQEQKELNILEFVGQAAEACTPLEKPVLDEHDIFSEWQKKNEKVGESALGR